MLPTGVQTVRRILWPSRDPPLIGVPSDTGPHAVWRISWTSWDLPLVSPQTQAPMLSGRSLGHPGILPWCPLRQGPVLSRGSLGHPGILPWCPLRHRPPCCLEDPLDIPGPCPLRHRPPSCPEVPLDIPGSQACQPLQFKTLETRWGKHCMLHQLGGGGPNEIISGIILSL